MVQFAHIACTQSCQTTCAYTSAKATAKGSSMKNAKILSLVPILKGFKPSIKEEII